MESSHIDEDDRPPVTSIFSLNPAVSLTDAYKPEYKVPDSNATTPLKNATTVTVIGFPPYKWRQVLEMAKSLDSVISFKKSDDEVNGNWMVITFASKQGVMAIKDYDGKMIDDSWILSVKMGVRYQL